MRSDYALYALAIIFFILSGVIAAYQAEQQQLWIVTTAVLGFAFIGLGFSQRPKSTSVRSLEIPPPPSESLPMQPTVPKVKEEMETPVEVAAPMMKLTTVKGIGGKRAEQLKALGINSVHDLARASAKDLASKLKISPKITGRWVGTAKEMVRKG